MGPSRVGCALGALLLMIVAGARAQTQTAVEYYYAAWDHYFVTSFPDEIAELDGGAFSGVWKRTGQTFSVWSDTSSGALPACRFFSTAFAPRSSHFYTPYAAECDSLKASASWQYESIAYYLRLPAAADGTCASGTVVLYRLYNNGQGGAPNHRYTTSNATFNEMQALGWTFEGDGRTGAFACVPEPATAEGLWRGTTASGRTITIAVLDNGTYYFVYTARGGSRTAGGLLGASSATDGIFTSLQARNVAFTSTLADESTVVTGTYAVRSSLQLTVGAGGSAETISATYDTAYDHPASAAALAGSYSGSAGHYVDASPAHLTIAADGTIAVSGTECTFAGIAVPRGSTGIFDFTIRATRGVCVNGGLGRPVKGILLFDQATAQFTAMAPFYNSLLGNIDMYFLVVTRD